MANTYYTLLTTIGQASIANTIALNQTVSLTHMAVGDGNGAPTVPKESQTGLVNEVYRAPINQLTTDLDNPNYLIAEMIVPTNVGGWSVREVGLFDEEGYLIAIANFPETYKPKLEEGSGRDMVIRIILQVSNTDVVTLKVDPTIILASQAWVIDNFSKNKLFPGGAKDQVLTKLSDNSGDMGWKYQSGVPVGTVAWFAMSAPPVGYLIANGAAVGRETYPDLFAAIGTTFGAGDGSTTFNLPDLIGRFAEGSATPGTVKEAGLPNITGALGNGGNDAFGIFFSGTQSGAFRNDAATQKTCYPATNTNVTNDRFYRAVFDASRSTPIYGASDTVQPPALTLLPCIKAFDATVNSGLVDVTALAQEMAGKVDRVINGKNIAYVVDSYRDNTGNWWRKWSDGWIEQGGEVSIPGPAGVRVTLFLPFLSGNYCVQATNVNFLIAASPGLDARHSTYFVLDYMSADYADNVLWSACGQGAQS